jgi:hypothetical protein
MSKHKPTTVDDLRDLGLRERDALIVAATLPYLPDGNHYIRVRHERDFFDTPDRVIDDLVDSVPTVGGTENVRRMSRVPHEYTDKEQIRLTPQPHGTTEFTVSLQDVDVIAKSADGYDWETDQSFLSDWGATSPTLYKHGVMGDYYTHPRLPTLPAYPV